MMPKRGSDEDFLLTLLWGMDTFLRPSMSRLMESYEAWERRTGNQRRWRQLEDRELVVREQRGEALVYRLTEAGRTAVMGGVNVPAAWDRAWDGRWRQVLFDLPARARQPRMRLWRWLRANRFGYLQGSVWVHPGPIQDVTAVLTEFAEDVEALTIMEAVCVPGTTDAAVVRGAWDFAEINRRHQAYVSAFVLGAADVRRLRSRPTALRSWLRSERLCWQQALAADPLLPRVLWPRGYQGEIAWQTRLRSLSRLAQSGAGPADG